MQEHFQISMVTSDGEKFEVPPDGFDQLTALGIIHIGITPEGGFSLSDSEGLLGPPAKPGTTFGIFGYTLMSERVEG